MVRAAILEDAALWSSNWFIIYHNEYNDCSWKSAIKILIGNYLLQSHSCEGYDVIKNKNSVASFFEAMLASKTLNKAKAIKMIGNIHP